MRHEHRQISEAFIVTQSLSQQDTASFETPSLVLIPPCFTFGALNRYFKLIHSVPLHVLQTTVELYS